jgi:hypothetical protein
MVYVIVYRGRADMTGGMRRRLTESGLVSIVERSVEVPFLLFDRSS